MGRTRFRKSFKVAPGVKINLNKKSVGVTIGGKGARYTVNTSGQRTLSTGIPGTGLYFVETSKGKKGSGKSKKGNNSAGENSGNASEVNLYSMVNVHAREAKQRVKNCPVLGKMRTNRYFSTITPVGVPLGVPITQVTVVILIYLYIYNSRTPVPLQVFPSR